MNVLKNKSFRIKMALLGMAPAILLAAGCVSGKQHRKALAERDLYRNLAEQNENTATAARAEAQVYRAQLNAASRDGRSKDEAIAGLTMEMVKMQSDFDQLTAAYSEQIEDQATPLAQDLSDKLADFASINGELLEYDAERGLVKFKSDVTFGAGSADLTKDATTAIAKLAAILNDGNARAYDLMIAGHTDNKPVSRQSTIAKGHKDNWYLSSHRAISVGDIMQKAGISKDRLAVVGYADQRPVASNTSNKGRALNRRVEVIILPAGSAQNGQFAYGESFDETIDAPSAKPANDIASSINEALGGTNFDWTWSPEVGATPAESTEEASIDTMTFDK